MASIKNLKKDINNVLGDVIEECYTHQLISDKKTGDKIEKIIDEAIDSFDGFIEKIHLKGVDNKKAHFKSISKELEEKAGELLEKLAKHKS